MKIAVVYDWIDRWGGVERLLLELNHIFPQADFFTSAVDFKRAPWAKRLKIKTSFLQRLPDFIKKSRIISLFFYPFAFESLQFDSYDVVISVTSSFAKSIITKPATKHICILLTPSRYLLLYSHPFESNLFRFVLRPYLTFMRKWDRIAAQRPDEIVAISEEVSERCNIYYQRKSKVIYPPFDLEYWSGIKNNLNDQLKLLPAGWENYYLIVSRLEPYKKVNLAIEAFNLSPQHKLVVVGKGSMLTNLQKLALKNTMFIHDIDDKQLAYLYMHAQALIMMQEEDFGYTAVEAQFFSCPVIAYDKGGVRETVVNGKTGLFFDKQNIASFRETLERYDRISYNFKHNIKTLGPAQTIKFDRNLFEKKIRNIVTNSQQDLLSHYL